MNLGFSVSLDWIGKLLSGRQTPGSVRLKKGSKYRINGTWFEITEVYPNAIVMEPADKLMTIERLV